MKDNSEDGTENLTDPCKHDEKWYVILLEVLFPFLIAGFGMVCAGVVLDIVQVILILFNFIFIFGFMFISILIIYKALGAFCCNTSHIYSNTRFVGS